MQKKVRKRATYAPYRTTAGVPRQKTKDLPTANGASNHTKHTICRGKTYDLPRENRRFTLEKGTNKPQKGTPALYSNCKHFDIILAVSSIQKITRTNGNEPPSGRKEAILSQ